MRHRDSFVVGAVARLVARVAQEVRGVSMRDVDARDARRAVGVRAHCAYVPVTWVPVRFVEASGCRCQKFSE